MDLILWRHAEAEEGAPDLARNLTGKGRRQAKRMARWLRAHVPRHARMLCSPAKRTRQTADALRHPYEVIEQIAPGCGVEQLLAATGWPQAEGLVILVGHNPAISQLASQLLSGNIFPMSMRKGSIIWFTNNTREDEPGVVMKAAMVPSMLKKGSR